MEMLKITLAQIFLSGAVGSMLLLGGGVVANACTPFFPSRTKAHRTGLTPGYRSSVPSSAVCWEVLPARSYWYNRGEHIYPQNLYKEVKLHV